VSNPFAAPLADDETDAPDGWRAATRLIHAGSLRSGFGETSEAMFLNSGFIYDSPEQARARFLNEDPGFIYSRFSNPTVAMFEARIADLEGADCAQATASGMAAIHAGLMCSLRAGDHVVAGRALFGSCRWIVETLMPRYGIETTLVDGCNLDEWEAALRPNTKLLFLESPTNPGLDVLDVPAIAALGKSVGAKLVVDNVFATPLGQKPLELGADIVVYSTTKHVDGQGRCLGGVVLCSQDFRDEHLYDYMRHTGPSMSPFNAWVMLKGLETLPLRMRQHWQTTAQLAEHFAGHKSLSRMVYPGHKSHKHYALAQQQMAAGGSLLGLDFKNGEQAAFTFANRLKLIRISNNLGDARSLLTHPATTTHQKLPEEEKLALGITPGYVRLSVGLEDPQDLIDDIENALAGL